VVHDVEESEVVVDLDPNGSLVAESALVVGNFQGDLHELGSEEIHLEMAEDNNLLDLDDHLAHSLQYCLGW
jgi:hypothetical protein